MQLVNTLTAFAGFNSNEERERRFQLARVLKVTEQMLAHANAGEWQQVEELENLRRLELENCLAMEMLEAETSSVVAEAVATLLHMNNQLVSLVRYAQSRMTEQHGEHLRTVTAVRAYGGEVA